MRGANANPTSNRLKGAAETAGLTLLDVTALGNAETPAAFAAAIRAEDLAPPSAP